MQRTPEVGVLRDLCDAMRPPDVNQLEDDLVAYLDGELPAGRAADVRRAIESDPRLAAEADQLDAVWDLLDAVPAPDARGVDVVGRVMKQVREADVPGERRILVIRRAVVAALSTAAAVLLAVLIGLLASSHQTPQDRQIVEAPPIPPDIEKVLVNNLDVILDRVTLENYDTVRALDEEGVFALGERTETP